MMRASITAILPQEGKRSRLIVYMDSVPWMTLHKSTAVDLKIATGPVEDPEELKRKILAREKQEAVDQLSRFLNLRPRSKNEVKGRLDRYGYPGDLIESVIETLVRAGLIDDSQFAQWWVKEGIRSGKKGRKRLKSELLARGVQKEVAEEALKKLYREEDDFCKAKELARRKYHFMVTLDENKAKRRIIDFLVRRGFSYNTAKEVWRSLGSGE